MPPAGVDVVITFRFTKKTSLSKQQIREDSRKAEEQYSRLTQTLTDAGLHAVGRRGEALGHLLIFVSCPRNLLLSLVKRERHSDFLSGLPTTPIALGARETVLSSAEGLRLVYTYITSTQADGGLGIIPGSGEWDLVESIMALHDRKFNESWVRRWSPRQIVSVELEKIRGQFGESVALYYAFLVSYTKALMFPAALGVIFYIFGTPYSPTYSILVFVWSVAFVEWWRVRERILSLHFGTRGSFRVEKRRADYRPGFPWWKRELRMVASLPILLLCAGILAAILTGIFIFEAFVTTIYKGPGHKYISFGPTILFAALVPRFLALYQVLARRLTVWENHSHHSSYTSSLTLKTFALNALVAYLGLGLSAFVYVPFGEGIMHVMQTWIVNETAAGNLKTLNATLAYGATETQVKASSVWDIDTSTARGKLNPARLRQQMFAFTVTNQVVGTFLEVGLPFILRAVASFRNGKKPQPTPGSPNGVKKRVVFEDEKEKGGMEEREFLDGVRRQVELPEYELFQDYSEMVTQFGYVALWSTIWPLASVMALLNNFLELRSDAFKMTVHHRRPIPIRTDTIGPWLEALTFLTWLSALTNSALVYLFCPSSQAKCSVASGINSTHLDKVHQRLFSVTGAGEPDANSATRELLITALLIALVASHGYLLVRVVVRHIIEMVFWKQSEEVKERESEDRHLKEKFLAQFVHSGEEGEVLPAGPDKEVEEETVVGDEPSGPIDPPVPPLVPEGVPGFWDHDEGLDEISRVSKEV